MDEELRRRIIAAHHVGRSERQIAEICGTSREAVRGVLVQAGIARNAHVTRRNMTGGDLADPKRADSVLRRF